MPPGVVDVVTASSAPFDVAASTYDVDVLESYWFPGGFSFPGFGTVVCLEVITCETVGAEWLQSPCPFGEFLPVPVVVVGRVGFG